MMQAKARVKRERKRERMWTLKERFFMGGPLSLADV
jgi:hypothetical protein